MKEFGEAMDEKIKCDFQDLQCDKYSVATSGAATFGFLPTYDIVGQTFDIVYY
jgi:hypothetical protein